MATVADTTPVATEDMELMLMEPKALIDTAELGLDTLLITALEHLWLPDMMPPVSVPTFMINISTNSMAFMTSWTNTMIYLMTITICLSTSILPDMTNGA